MTSSGFGFANAVDEEEAKELYETFAVPTPGKPLFQAAAANLSPWTEVKVNTKNPERGPLLLISGERDNTVPWAIVNASYKRQGRNEGVTEIASMPNRGHALVIDGARVRSALRLRVGVQTKVLGAAAASVPPPSLGASSTRHSHFLAAS
jgi:hypothetical protein